jgi:hypothetical protein
MILATEHCELFVDQEGEPHLTTKVAPRKTYHIQMKAAREWLSFLAYKTLGKVASDTVLSTVISGLSGAARHGGEDGTGIEHPVYLRYAPAPDGNGYYVDLCDDQWRCVHVTASGWRVVEKPPVKFRRSQAMRPLPAPSSNGDLGQLWRFANVSEKDQAMVLAWMLETMRPDTPFPILELIGGHGSGKSDAEDRLRSLLDQNAVNLRAAPKDVESIHVGAKSNYLASYNNVSRLSAAMQDALCTLSTGGGFASRTLFTNTDETVIESMRPVIINGINPIATAQDLIDRCIRIELPTITERRKASDLKRGFDSAYSFLFGALLDLFAHVLTILPTVRIEDPPRMADFSQLGQAVYQALGSQRDFAADYRERQKAAVVVGIEASPAAAAVLELIEAHQKGFEGTVKSLLDTLSSDFKREGDGWPKSSRGLSDILRRQAPALDQVGVSVVFDPVRHEDGYHVRVKKKFSPELNIEDQCSGRAGSTADPEHHVLPEQAPSMLNPEKKHFFRTH